jgi:nitrate reductase NapE component
MNNLEETNFLIKHFSDITSLLEVILVGIYVYFTIKMFQQIKTQTDLQLKAYLNTDDSIINESELNNKGIEKSELDRTFSKDWKLSMENSFPALSGSEIFDGGYYCLSFTNYGNTEIKEIEICCDIKIQNSKDSVTNRKLTKEDNKVYKTKIKQILKKGETVKFPFFSTASFPIFSITTSGNYKDVRNQDYPFEKQFFSGENVHIQ